MKFGDRNLDIGHLSLCSKTVNIGMLDWTLGKVENRIYEIHGDWPLETGTWIYA